MAKKMRALSIRQPYAEQIMLGMKKIEYRSFPAYIRERVHIYASHTPGPLKEWKRIKKQPGDLPTGVLIGTVEITDCTLGDEAYEWHLARPKRSKKMLKPKEHPQPAWFWPFGK